ncbi:MAG TPA: cupredoxin domain-containing protein [Geobacterales bacterium]|jgi:plastocyanin|nr:cupredoxin domain-containing protein [Geobacterales bacterium]
MPFTRLLIVLLTAAFASYPVSVRADDPFPIGLSLKDHVFDPAELKAPAGRDIAITLKNEDESFEEFDSDALRTEKIVTAKGKVTIKLKPLAAGKYPFRGEFHDATAQGVLIVE